ncbi:MAG: HD domain-containing protein [Syntrophaceae bacterium]
MGSIPPEGLSRQNHVVVVAKGLVTSAGSVLSGMLMQDIIAAVKDYCRDVFSVSKLSHNWDHTERVFNLCMHIGAIEGADLQILALAAYLHDIGRSHQDRSKGEICHAEEGARMAREILASYAIDPAKKDNIIHCVLTHRYRNSHVPQSLEAKVLFDADKLDAIGAVGIARAYLFAGEVGAMLHNPHCNPHDTRPYTKDDTGYREFTVKLSHIKDRMLTSEGRRMAQERHAFMEAFFERFLKEHAGEI